MATHPIRFGIQTGQQSLEWAQLLALWQKADAWGYDSLWNFDHFYPIFVDPEGPCLESWTTLAALAQATRRARVGTMVSGNTYRHPCVTAKMAATLDHVRGRRPDAGADRDDRTPRRARAARPGEDRENHPHPPLLPGRPGAGAVRVPPDGVHAADDARAGPQPVHDRPEAGVPGHGRALRAGRRHALHLHAVRPLLRGRDPGLCRGGDPGRAAGRKGGLQLSGGHADTPAA